MNRMDTLQIVFDRTDWKLLRQQKRGLLAAIDYAEFLNRPQTRKELQGLLNWLDAMQEAAEMDGYQVKLTKEPTL